MVHVSYMFHILLFLFCIFLNQLLSPLLYSEQECAGNSSSIDRLYNIADEIREIDPYGNACNSNCPDGYKELALHAQAKSFESGETRDLIFLIENDYRFESEEFPNKKHSTIDSIQSLRATILHLNSECYKIKKLVIQSHGDAGHIHLQDKNPGITSMNLDELNGLSCAFAKDAEIIFEGCSIGNGIVGEDFLRGFGRRLLWENGGSVTAANYYTTTFPAPFSTWLPRFSLDGKTRTYTIKPRGINERISDSFTSIKDRKEFIDEWIKKYNELIPTTKDKNYLKSLNVGLTEFKRAREVLEKAEIVGGLSKLPENEREYLDKVILNGIWIYDSIEGKMNY